MDQTTKMNKWNHDIGQRKRINVFYKIIKSRLDVGIIQMSDLLNKERITTPSKDRISPKKTAETVNVQQNIYNSPFPEQEHTECMHVESKESQQDVFNIVTNSLKDSTACGKNEQLISGVVCETKEIDINETDMAKIHDYISRIKSFMDLDTSPKLVQAKIVESAELEKTPINLTERYAQESMLSDEEIKCSNFAPSLNTSYNKSTPEKRKLIRIKITVPKNTLTCRLRDLPKIVSTIAKDKLNVTCPGEYIPETVVPNEVVNADRSDCSFHNNLVKEDTNLVDNILNTTCYIKNESKCVKQHVLNYSKKLVDRNRVTPDQIKIEDKKEALFKKVPPNIIHSSVDELARGRKRAFQEGSLEKLSPIQSEKQVENLSLAHNLSECLNTSCDSEIIKELVMSRFESSFKAKQRKLNCHDVVPTKENIYETPKGTQSNSTQDQTCLTPESRNTTINSNSAPLTIVTNVQIEHCENDETKGMDETDIFFTPIQSARSETNENYYSCSADSLKKLDKKLKTGVQEEPIYTPVKRDAKKNVNIVKPTPKKTIDSMDFDKISVYKPGDYLNREFIRYSSEEDLNLKANSKSFDPIFKSLDDGLLNESLSETSFSSFTDGRSIETIDASVLVSLGGSYYYRPRGNTFTVPERFKENRLISIPTYESVNINNGILEEENAEQQQKIKQMKTKADAQEDIMRQASNAIYMYKHSNNKVSIATQIEAEKVLLVASLRRKAIHQQIPKVGYEEIQETSALNLGTVYVTELSFPLKPEVAEKNQTLRHKSWIFLCTVSCGERVLCSSIVQGNNLSEIRIKESFVFEEVTPDFEVQLSIYAMKVPKELKKKRNFIFTPCFKTIEKTLRKLYDLAPGGRWRASSIIKRNNNYPQMTSFLRWGQIKLRFCDLSRNFNWKLSGVPTYATLTGYVNMHISSAVNICNKQSGFLNVATEINNGCKEWNRRWCVLDGPILSFWNYPHDAEETSPLRILDLRLCFSDGVSHASREFCARPRTLLLETVAQEEIKPMDLLNTRPGSAVVRHFLSADTLAEMQAWERELNSVICSLRYWNAARCKLIYSSG